MTCRTDGCQSTFIFGWQLRAGIWKLNKFFGHTNECGLQLCGSDDKRKPAAKAKFCVTAYTTRQIIRAVFVEDGGTEGDITTKTISRIVNAKGIYSRKQSMAHYRSVRPKILRHMAASRAVDMVVMQECIDLLESCGHRAKFCIVTG